MRPSSARAALTVVLLAPLLGCNAETREDSAAMCRGCNVILAVVDTLRADRLGSYGHHRDTSPNIDAFARNSVLFEHARSQAACTFPSVNSLLTSRYPAHFLGQGTMDGEKVIGIPEDIKSIAEILRNSGYTTVAISGSPIVRDAGSPSRFSKIGGFERGFDIFETHDCREKDCVWEHKPHAEQINDRALQILSDLEDCGALFFLYLHYMDVHGPYAVPGEDSRRFGPPLRRFQGVGRARKPQHSRQDAVRRGGDRLRPA